MKAKITLVLTCLLALLYFNSFAQNFPQRQQSPIVVNKALGTTFTMDGVKLTPAQMEEVVKHNPEALQEMKLARRNMVPVTILSYAGGMLIGYPLGTAIGGGEPNWAMAGVGAGLVALSIPFSVGFSKHAQQAATIYNESLHSSHNWRDRINMKVGFSGNGLGFNMTF